MLDYVAKGEKIKASTINGIIDSVTNLYYPSNNLNFRNTSHGTLLNAPNSYDIKNRYLAPCFLQTCWNYDTELSTNTLNVMLGRDIGEAKNQITIYNKIPDGIYIYDENRKQIKEITKEAWPDNKTFFTGFINTEISSLIIENDLETETDKQCGFYGVTYKYEEEKISSDNETDSETDNETDNETDISSDNKSGIYFVLTNSRNESKIKENLINALSSDDIESNNLEFVDRVLIASQSYSEEEDSNENNQSTNKKTFKTYGLLQQYRLGPITKVNDTAERLPLPFELKTEIETKQEGTDEDTLKTKYKYKVKMYWYGQGAKEETSGSEGSGSEGESGSESTYDSAIQWNDACIKGELDDSLKQELENPNQDLNKSGWINIYESKQWLESLEEEDEKFYALIYLRAKDVNPISGDYYLSSIIDTEKSKFTITKDARYKQLNWLAIPKDFDEKKVDSSGFPSYVEINKDAPNQVLVYCTIGSVKGTKNNLNVTQGLIGTQHFVDMSWNSSNSTFEIDSQISSLSLSSLQWFEKESDGETENDTKDKYLGLYNFNNTSTDLSLVIDNANKSISEYYNILVRESDKGGGATLKYATLCIDLSGSSNNISTDTEITATHLQSIDKKYSEDVSADYITLYNFDKTEKDLTLSINLSNLNLPEKYQILVKDTNNDGFTTLKYANLYVDLSSLSNNTSIYTDTEITATGLQSIDKKYSEDVSADYITLYNFDKTEKDLSLSVSKSNPTLPENYSILVKDNNDGLITLKYADLSVDFSRTISTDTEVKHLIGTKNKQRSINIVHSEELNGDYLELYNFPNGSNGPYTFLPNKLGYEENAYGTKHTFICRQTDEYGTNPEVAYMNAKVVYPEGDDSSITYNKEDETAYKYELYEWNNHETEEITALIDVNNVTREPEVLPSIAPYHKILTKGPDGNLNYVDLKLDVKRRVEADSELDNISKTIQLKYHNDIPYFCLYGIDKTPKEVSVLLKENDEVNTGIKYVALNGNEIEIQELKIILPDLSSGGDHEGDIYNISSSVTILSNNVEVLSGDIEDIEEQLSNFWVLGENADKCYGKAIGDSNKNEVINLDEKILAGDWQVMGNAVVNGMIQCNELTASNYIGCTGDIMCNGLTASTYINCAGDIMCDDLNCTNVNCTNVVCDSLTIGGTTINGNQLARLLALLN